MTAHIAPFYARTLTIFWEKPHCTSYSRGNLPLTPQWLECLEWGTLAYQKIFHYSGSQIGYGFTTWIMHNDIWSEPVDIFHTYFINFGISCLTYKTIHITVYHVLLAQPETQSEEGRTYQDEGKGAATGSVPVGVEGISNLPFQGPAWSVWWPATPSQPYLWPSKDRSTHHSWVGWSLLRWFSI